MKENEKDQVQTLKDALFSQSKHAAQRMDDAELAKCDAFCADSGAGSHTDSGCDAVPDPCADPNPVSDKLQRSGTGNHEKSHQ